MTARRLSILLDGQLAGTVESADGGGSLVYSDRWIEPGSAAVPLSLSMPLSSARHPAKTIQTWLDGPEVRLAPMYDECSVLPYTEPGEIDMSHRAGRGVFSIWNEPGVFESASNTPHRTIGWSDDAELCADAVYLETTGHGPEEILPGLRALADA